MIAGYFVDVEKLIRRLMPPILRRPKQTSWLKALLAPLKSLNDQLLSFVTNSRYLANVSGQTLSLESYLNDQFDNELRRIKIIHEAEDSEFDYFASEGQAFDYDYYASEGASDRYMKYAGESITAIASDFQVLAPLAVNGQDAQIKANIEKYKIAAVTYSINYN
ncbi:MAG: hypothetical protein MI975_25345 [Cytophagales bacterium]|nr:hypothetical protein [Cytophagales bacterium]